MFSELTFNVTDADSMEEDNVLVRHLPHHACRFKERLLESERPVIVAVIQAFKKYRASSNKNICKRSLCFLVT